MTVISARVVTGRQLLLAVAMKFSVLVQGLGLRGYPRVMLVATAQEWTAEKKASIYKMGLFCSRGI